MLKNRIIPILLWNGYTLVKGQNFNNNRRAGSPITTIKIYNSRDVDEIVFFDISEKNLKIIDTDFIQSVTDCVDVPITIGGGITNISQMDDLFLSGADKICLNSVNFENPNLINDAAKKFGSQAVTVSVDVKNINNEYICYYKNGTISSHKKVAHWVKECVEKGAGEIIINSIDHDGLMNGYDNNLIKIVSSNVKVPIIAAGGAGNYKHFYEAFLNGANAFAAASLYHFTNSTPTEAKKYLLKKNIYVRENFNINN